MGGKKSGFKCSHCGGVAEINEGILVHKVTGKILCPDGKNISVFVQRIPCVTCRGMDPLVVRECQSCCGKGYLDPPKAISGINIHGINQESQKAIQEYFEEEDVEG